MLSGLLLSLRSQLRVQGLRPTTDQWLAAIRYIRASPGLAPEPHLMAALKPILVLRPEDAAGYYRAWRALYGKLGKTGKRRDKRREPSAGPGERPSQEPAGRGRNSSTPPAEPSPSPSSTTPQQVREPHIQQQQERGRQIAAQQRWGVSAELLERPLQRLREQDLQALEQAARHLIQRLRLRQRGRRQGGAVDLGRTLRASRRSFGEPLRLIRQRPRRHPTRWVVLADISGSMGPAVRACLALMLACSRVLGRELRVFVFVSQVAEASALLKPRDPQSSSKAILHAPGVDHRGHSDYGAAFRAFDTSIAGVLDRRTVLLILGDGRTNFRDPGIDKLQSWRRHCSRVFWFNPEDPERWSQGDSRVDHYAEHVDALVDISTVERLLEALLRQR